jgi:hypothetical protein
VMNLWLTFSSFQFLFFRLSRPWRDFFNERVYAGCAIALVQI